MRKFGLIVTLVACLFVSGQVLAQAAKKSADRAAKNALAVIGNHHQLNVGEKLNYVVKWNNVSAARFSLEVAGKGTYHGQEGYELVTRVETIGNIKKLIEVNDIFTTFLDAKTRLTYRLNRDIKEGPKVDKGTTIFDQAKLQVVVDDQKTYKIEKQTFDVPGLMWAIRNLDFSGPKVQKLNGFDGQAGKPVALEVERLEKETLNVGGKEIETYKLAIRTKNKTGAYSDDMQIRMWIGADAKRIPVQMAAVPPFGEIRAELKPVGEKQ